VVYVSKWERPLQKIKSSLRESRIIESATCLSGNMLTTESSKYLYGLARIVAV